MRTSLGLFASATLVAGGLSSAAHGQVLFSDNFEPGATGTFTTVIDPAGGGSLFNPNYKYTNLGIAGDVRSGTGALLETNRGITAYINGLSINGTRAISIKYDVYLQPRDGGSTELATIGVGNGTAPFELFLGGQAGTEKGQGVFATTSTDSDTAAAGDYVLAQSTGTGAPTRLFDGDAAGSTQSGTGFTAIFPAGTAGPSGDAPDEAIAAFRFTAVELLIRGTTVTYRLNGVDVATSTATVSPTGLVGIGLVDPFPGANNSTTLGDGTGTIAIIDNLVVTAVPEPTTLAALAGLGSLTLRRRRVR